MLDSRAGSEPSSCVTEWSTSWMSGASDGSTRPNCPLPFLPGICTWSPACLNPRLLPAWCVLLDFCSLPPAYWPMLVVPSLLLRGLLRPLLELLPLGRLVELLHGLPTECLLAARGMAPPPLRVRLPGHLVILHHVGVVRAALVIGGGPEALAAHVRVVRLPGTVDVVGVRSLLLALLLALLRHASLRPRVYTGPPS